MPRSRCSAAALLTWSSPASARCAGCRTSAAGPRWSLACCGPAGGWNHGLGEIVTALLDAGLQITGLTEHDSVPWEALPGKMECIGGGEWRLADRPWRLPHSYTLQAVKHG